MTTFAVVTRVAEPESGGNMALTIPYLAATPNNIEVKLITEYPALSPLALSFRSAVFTLGEILILDSEHGREVDGRQRKPGKWDVDIEHFDDIEAAVKRAKAVQA